MEAVVQNIEQHLARKGEGLPARVSTPLSSGYRPELDTSEELNPNDAAHYQLLIGIL